MKCPRDFNNLVVKQVKGVVGNFCNKCNGIFYEKKYVESFKFNFQTEILDVKIKETCKENSSLNCPLCKEKMNILNFNKYEIDYCNNCKGIWFDKDEIFKIIDDYGKDQNSGESIFITFLGSLLG